MTFSLRFRDHTREFETPIVMGVINMSPDSFFNVMKNNKDALKQVDYMVSAGASIIDVGGEATNPFVQIEEANARLDAELDRVLPIVEAIKKRFDVLVSVDTSQPKLMLEAVKLGADLINDERALAAEGAMQAALECKVPVCLMHFFDPPRIPNSSTLENLLQMIKTDLENKIASCIDYGLDTNQLIIDVGFGQGNYGKNTAENYYLLAKLNSFQTLGLPMLVGWSRKSMIGDVLNGAPPKDRLSGSIAAATIAMMQGAHIIRTHDVKETVDAVRIFQATNDFLQ